MKSKEILSRNSNYEENLIKNLYPAKGPIPAGPAKTGAGASKLKQAPPVPSYSTNIKQPQQFVTTKQSKYQPKPIDPAPSTLSKPLSSSGSGRIQAPAKKPASKFSSAMSENAFSNKPDDRVSCRRCKRKFNPDRIGKHESVCIGPVKNVVVKPPVRVQKKKKIGVPLWKKQHLDFINNVRFAKKMKIVQERGGDIRSIPVPVQHYDPSSDYKQCPYCSRKFSEQVAQRHIPNCKNIINKPKPPPKPSNIVMAEKKTGAKPGYCVKCGSKSMPGSRKCVFCGY